MKVAVDTNVIIAGLLTWHEHHSEACEALGNALSETLILRCRPLLEGFASSHTAGERCYDMVIAACAKRAKAQRFFTLNARHFLGLEASDFEIVDVLAGAR